MGLDPIVMLMGVPLEVVVVMVAAEGVVVAVLDLVAVLLVVLTIGEGEGGDTVGEYRGLRGFVAEVLWLASSAPIVWASLGIR